MLRDTWVTEIFRRMELTFGSKFSNLWRNVDPEEMRRYWAEKLAGFADNPEAIKSAMDACDARTEPPNLPEFLQLCRDAARRQAPKHLALEAPKMDPEIAKQRLAEISKQLGAKWANP